MPANSNNGQLGASDPNPFYITGLIDAEGCFMVEVSNGKKIVFALRFAIKLHNVDLPLLKKIQAFFGAGSITIKDGYANYRVSKLDDIMMVIIPHLVNYPLQSAKLIDFYLWRQCGIKKKI